MSGQVWAVNSKGGYFYNDNLSENFRDALQPSQKFRQFADIKDAAHQGLGKGQTFHWDVVANVATQGTTLTETDTVPETNFTIAQGTMTITEYANSVPYTGKLEALSQAGLTNIVTKALKNDAMKAMDTDVAAEFDKAALRYVGITTVGVGGVSTDYALTTNGTATATNGVALNTSHAANIINIMRERNIPSYEGDDYVCIAHPTTLATLQSEMDAVYQYTQPGLNMIFNGEIGRYHNCRFVQQSHISKTGMGTYTTAWGTSAWAAFFGEDTVAEAVAIPEEIRAKIPEDFGRSQGIAWYYLGGFGLTHDSVNNASMNASESRILLWDSAA